MGQDLDVKFRGWYASLQASLRSLEVIEREVEASTGLPVAWFEVLTFLVKNDDGRRRMGELAEQSLLSRGGATRLVARMEEAGLVVREIPPDDRRVTYAVITAQGRATLADAKPAYRAAVARYFTDAIDEDEAETLRSIGVRVLELTGDECAWLVRDLTADQRAHDAR